MTEENPIDRDGDGRSEKARRDGVTDADLVAWVRSARVSYEVLSHIAGSSRVGFDVTVRAMRPEGCTGDPTCAACDRFVERLFALVEDCLPPGTRHEHEPFDHAFHLRPETGFASELQVVVSVLHRTGTFDEVDDTDRALVDVVVRDLESRGVQPRVFHARTE